MFIIQIIELKKLIHLNLYNVQSQTNLFLLLISAELHIKHIKSYHFFPSSRLQFDF